MRGGGGPETGPKTGSGAPALPVMESPANFLGYAPGEVEPDSARAVLLPVPYDGTASYRKGARLGPAAIIEASRQLEDFDLELGCDPSELGIYTAAPIDPGESGPEALVDEVQRAVSARARPGVLVGVLGGEHTVAIGAVRGMSSRFEGLSVLFLDAHADMRDEYQGSRYSHACTARRIAEICDLVQVGVRSAEREEWDRMRAHGVPVVTWPPQEEMDVTERVLSHLDEAVYVSIDLDVLDTSVMSAVGTPEPGGMHWHELLSLLRAVSKERRIVGFDVSELAPGEGPEACSYTAAKLVYKLIGYALV